MGDELRSTQRFTERAKDYAAHRPGHASGAIDAVFAGLGDPGGLVVADVGAGTGISARLFADRGARVIAVEPNAAMRASAQAHPRVIWHDGTAERTGLPDAAADIVTACQAFHWFATPEAMRECARVARRRVAILQYERDERDEATRAYGELVRAYATDDTEALRARALTVFERFPHGPVERTLVPSRQALTLEGLLGRAASASYLPKEGPEADALRRDLTALFERYRRDGSFTMVLVTHTLVADVTKSTQGGS